MLTACARNAPVAPSAVPLDGEAEMAVFLADIGYAPMGAGHCIRNTGSSVLRVLIGFNSGRYQANDLSASLTSNPVDVIATNLGLAQDVVARLPHQTSFLVPGP
jgi:oxalate decarboxylase